MSPDTKHKHTANPERLLPPDHSRDSSAFVDRPAFVPAALPNAPRIPGSKLLTSWEQFFKLDFTAPPSGPAARYSQNEMKAIFRKNMQYLTKQKADHAKIIQALNKMKSERDRVKHRMHQALVTMNNAKRLHTTLSLEHFQATKEVNVSTSFSKDCEQICLQAQHAKTIVDFGQQRYDNLKDAYSKARNSYQTVSQRLNLAVKEANTVNKSVRAKMQYLVIILKREKTRLPFGKDWKSRDGTGPFSIDQIRAILGVKCLESLKLETDANLLAMGRLLFNWGFTTHPFCVENSKAKMVENLVKDQLTNLQRDEYVNSLGDILGL